MDIKPLLDILFAYIFSHSVGCLFVLLFFLCAALLCRSFLLCFSPTYLFLLLFSFPGKTSREELLMMMSKSLLPMFSFRSFMVSGVEFTFLIHFKFIFMCGVRQWSSFILSHITVQFSQHYLLKRPFFTQCIFLAPLS